MPIKKIKAGTISCLGQYILAKLWQPGSLDPIGEHGQGRIRVGGAVIGQMQPEIVLPAHIAVHQEFHRYARAFTWLEDHRTDGRGGRSTPLLDFDVGILGETQGSVTCIGKLK